MLTAIIAGNSDSEATALIPFGSIFGALMFSSSIILSQVILHSRHTNGEIGLKVNRGESIKPIIFYVTCAVGMLLISLVAGEMTWYYASIFPAAYVVYGAFVILDERKRRKSDSIITSDATSGVISTDQDVRSIPNDQTKKSLMESHVIPEPKADEQNSSEDEAEQSRNVLSQIQKGIQAFLHLIFSWSVPGFSKEGWNIWREVVRLTLSTGVVILNQGYNYLTTQLSWIL